MRKLFYFILLFLFTTAILYTTSYYSPSVNADILHGTAPSLESNTWEIPGTIGSTTPNTGAFTNLSASGTVSGTGFTTLMGSYLPLSGGTLTGPLVVPLGTCSSGNIAIQSSGLSTLGINFAAGNLAQLCTGNGNQAIIWDSSGFRWNNTGSALALGAAGQGWSQVYVGNGTVCSTPAYTFSSATTTGLAWDGSSLIRVCVAAANPIGFSSTGIIGIGTNRGLGTSGNGFGRIYLTGGTALTTSDIVLSAGWGTTAQYAVTGDDSRFHITVLSQGAGIGANPTFGLTFKDGTWTSAPYAQCHEWNDLASLAPISSFETTSATNLTSTFVGTPTTAHSYITDCATKG